MTEIKGPDFLPGTRSVGIGDGVFYRPIRSLASGTLAGEGLTEDGHGDSSGCVEIVNGRRMTSPPRSAIHRLYWWEGAPERCVSSILSYPFGLGHVDHYFWEISVENCERFSNEVEMEARVKAFLLGLASRVPRLEGSSETNQGIPRETLLRLTDEAAARGDLCYVRPNVGNQYRVGGNSNMIAITQLQNDDGSVVVMPHEAAVFLAAWLVGTVILQGGDESTTVTRFVNTVDEAAARHVSFSR
jgi:hypothetical protein